MPRDRGRRASGTRRARYSKDLLDRVVYQYYVLGKSTRSISRNLDIPRRVVQRALHTFKTTGEPYRSKTRTDYYHGLSAEEMDVRYGCVELDIIGLTLGAVSHRPRRRQPRPVPR